jgi:hypothetical protein
MADELEESVPEGAAVLPEIPAELGVHPLLLAVLHAIVFLDGSNDEVVDPDAAVEAMEYMAAYLQRLSGAELRRVQEDLHALTSFARQEKWPKQHIRFFKEFASNFGIGETEEA